MQWSRFDKTNSPPAHQGAAASGGSSDANRHLRELNAFRLDSDGEERVAIPNQGRAALEKRLGVVLSLYPDAVQDKRRRDGAKMEGILATVISTQREYALAADHLDVRRGGFFGFLAEGLVNTVIYVFDWVLLTMSFFILFSSITESWRPSPEPVLIIGAATFFALLSAALVKQLAKYAVLYGWARFLYMLPWTGAACGDLYFLNKQGKLNVGLIMTGFLAGLGGVTYFHARHSHHQTRPRRPRKELLLDYDAKYEQFSQHYFLWLRNLDGLSDDPEHFVAKSGVLDVS